MLLWVLLQGVACPVSIALWRADVDGSVRFWPMEGGAAARCLWQCALWSLGAGSATHLCHGHLGKHGLWRDMLSRHQHLVCGLGRLDQTIYDQSGKTLVVRPRVLS